jgi:hypothetical protein
MDTDEDQRRNGERERYPEKPAHQRSPSQGPARAARGRDHRAKAYAGRRRGWIQEHSQDDRFLIFLGVAAFLALAGILTFATLAALSTGGPIPEHQPVPTAELFHAPAEEISPGLVRVTYSFPYDRSRRTVRESCPQIRDWLLKGQVSSLGILVGGRATSRPFFRPGRLSVEADAALITGSQLTLALASIYDNCEGNLLRFDLNASRGEGWPSTARLGRYEDGSLQQSGPLVEIPPLRARRDPPLFHRVRLELAGKILAGFYAPPGGKLAKVCQMEVADHMGAGKVVLTGELSHTAYDNVVITGRPHPAFIKKRTVLYNLFQRTPGPGGAKPAEAAAESPVSAGAAAPAESPAPAGAR